VWVHGSAFSVSDSIPKFGSRKLGSRISCLGIGVIGFRVEVQGSGFRL
jgi:hypothetical protein